jgi:hypothetical protein
VKTICFCHRNRRRKKATEIYCKKSTNQCTSYAGKPAGFIFNQNKPYQTNLLFISATLFKTKLLQ